jgi:uncharacterized protein (TIGR04255 family)
MSESGEVFLNAPLKGVAYEVRFPSLFSISQAIGKFQLEIMDDFPKASQLFATPFAVIEEGVPKLPAGSSDKIITSWQFASETGNTKVTVKLDSLSITSEEYHSYDNPAKKKFKEVINKTVTKFVEQVPITKFTRIGLRYTDHCPLAEKTNRYFKKYYEPTFNIDKYRIDDWEEGFLVIRTKKEKHNILFQSRIEKIDGEYKYVMDFDAYAENVNFDDFLAVTDELRDLDRSEFLSNTTEDFKEYMRGH